MAKYADNGGAESRAQPRQYFHNYDRRDRLGGMFRRLEESSEDFFRKFVPSKSLAVRSGKSLDWKAIAKTADGMAERERTVSQASISKA